MKEHIDLSKIRLICSDIDGTLLHGEKSIPRYVKDEIWRLYRKGIVFAFSTGRLPYEVDPLLEGLPKDMPYIAGNGAVLKCGKEILKEYFFIAGKLRPLAYKYSDLGVTVIFSYGELERPLVLTPWTQENVMMFPGLDKTADDRIWERPIQRMFFYHPHGDYLDTCRRDLSIYDDEYEICSQNDCSIQIGPPGCSKASGVQMLAKHLGANREAILCVVDAENDIPMIRYAGIGVSVANGSEAIKQAADYVTEGCCAEGVWEILRRCGQ